MSLVDVNPDFFRLEQRINTSLDGMNPRMATSFVRAIGHEQTMEEIKDTIESDPFATLQQLIAISAAIAPSRPRDLPDCRANMIKAFPRWAPARAELLGDKNNPSVLQAHQAHTRSAPLWWIDAGLTEVIDAAATSVPLDTTLEPAILTEAAGIAFFARPVVRGLYDEPGWHFNAMQWGPIRLEDGRRAVIFALLTLTRSGWGVTGESWWPFGDRLDADMLDAPDPAQWADAQTTHIQDRQLAAALWLLSSQKGLADTGIEPLYNAARKRAERAFLPTSPIRVLTLRGMTGSESKGGDVEWSHRWIVRGHWRQQPCGPGNSGRRPKWIAPHIKGPADKPLDMREGVRVL